MRLINTRTLELREFSNPDEINDDELILEELEPDQSKPNEQRLNGYAILSHTWGDEEVTFQDWLYITKQNPARWGWIYNKEEVRRIKARQGYKKIKGACKQAKDEGFSWIWADTNCIDKTNLTELSEAINSMYHWYQKAQVCYVYLADVPPCSREDCIRGGSRFRGSRWFTRGWTLQELIAPKHLKFFSNSWTLISNKPEIKKTIEEITNIPSSVLTNPYDLTCRGGHLSIAEIMSWASTRTTTRKEDMAYSLMGLFDVNMPLLYGEGTKAFIRLQLEIIQKSSDVTFLVWKRELSLSILKAEPEYSSWLAWTTETIAQEPKAFCFGPDIHEIVGAVGPHWATEYPRFLRISNLGLSLSIPLVETLHPNLQFAVLPYDYSDRKLWVPLGAFGCDYYRLGGSNFAALSVPTIGYTAKETELTLPIYRSSDPCGITIKNDRQVYWDHWKGSHINILLAFPAGL